MTTAIALHRTARFECLLGEAKRGAGLRTALIRNSREVEWTLSPGHMGVQS